MTLTCSSDVTQSVHTCLKRTLLNNWTTYTTAQGERQTDGKTDREKTGRPRTHLLSVSQMSQIRGMTYNSWTAAGGGSKTWTKSSWWIYHFLLIRGEGGRGGLVPYRLERLAELGSRLEGGEAAREATRSSTCIHTRLYLGIRHCIFIRCILIIT
jgi:hypothetical protein